MVKRLERLLFGVRKGVQNSLLALAITTASAGIVSGCDMFCPTPNRPPSEATLSVSPIYGQAPLEVEVFLDGEDPDGKANIVEYEVTAVAEDGTLIATHTDSSPIDNTTTFDEPGIYTIRGTVTDYAGEMLEATSMEVEVYAPEDEEEPEPEPEPEPENNLPEITSTPITEINEGREYNYDVNATDVDEDILEYSLVQSPDWLSIDSSTGAITGTAPIFNPSNPNYSIEVGVSDGKDTATQEFTLTAKNLPDFSGQLQDNETDSPQAGLIKVYDSLDDSLLKQIITADGNFNLQLDEIVSEAILQARIMDGETDKSYIRTITLDGGQDYSDLVVRAVPYDSPLLYDDGLIPEQITPAEFKTFMEETNFLSPLVNGNINPGLKKWNFGELPDTQAHPVFKGVAIIKSHGDYSFTNPQALGIKTILENSVYPSSHHPMEEGITIEIYDVLPEAPFGLGRGLVFPSNRDIASLQDKVGIDGYLEGFWVELYPDDADKEKVVIHEVWGHGMNYPSHTATLSPSQSVMSNTATTLDDFSAADIKGSYLVGEENYLGMESSDNILGLDWLDE